MTTLVDIIGRGVDRRHGDRALQAKEQEDLSGLIC